MCSQSQISRTIISADTQFKGDVTFKGKTEIRGQVDGTIQGQGDLYITGDARCKANIVGTKVTIDGWVKGDITVSQSLQMNATAKVMGRIESPKLIFAEGAALHGECRIGHIDSKQTSADVSAKANGKMNGKKNTGINGNSTSSRFPKSNGKVAVESSRKSPPIRTAKAKGRLPHRRSMEEKLHINDILK